MSGDFGEKLLRVAQVHPCGKREYDPVSKDRFEQACLAPGASVSKLSLENVVNANLVWKWLRKRRAKEASYEVAVDDHRAARAVPTFVPVIEASGRAEGVRDGSSVLAVAPRDEAGSRPVGHREGSARVGQASAILPNGVRLSLELSDPSVMMSMIRAPGDVPSVR